MSTSVENTSCGTRPLYDAARRAEDRSRRRQRENDFRASSAVAEASLYRIIIKRSTLSKPRKRLLLAMANLWFRHGKPNAIMVSMEKLLKKLGWVRQTLRGHLRHLIAAGYVAISRMGRGPGHPTEYVVDLHIIQQRLDPKARITTGVETASCDGEILPVTKIPTGLISPRAYRDHPTIETRKWRSLVFELRTSYRNAHRLRALTDRIADNLWRSRQWKTPSRHDSTVGLG